jgi:type IV secretion system protein TrbL
MVHPHGCGVLAPICGAGNDVASAIFSTITSWFVSAAEWGLGLVAGVLVQSTTPPVTTAWFLAREHLLFEVAAPVALLALVGGALHAVVRSELHELWRTVVVRLPVAILCGAAGAGIVGIALTATDQLCDALGTSSGDSLSGALHGIGLAVLATGVPGPVEVLVTGMVLLGSVALWFELVVRAAAITIATALLPLVFASTLWPPAVNWAKRLVETLGALIVSKAVIVLVLSLAIDALTHVTTGPSTAITGGAMLLFAAFAPFAVLRMVPLVEAAAVGHLEGMRQRATSSVQHASRRAVSMAAGAGGEVLPSIGEVGTNPVGMMPGVEGDLIAGTALDMSVKHVRGPSPVKAIPASAGTHVWERDKHGPRLVWKPPGYVPEP